MWRWSRRPLVAAVGCALAIGIFAPAATAAPVEHVNNSANSGAGSLREAMTNVDAGGEIVFDLATADPVLLSQIQIDRNVTISGLGAGTTKITGASNDRVFQLAVAATVTIRDLEITGGNAPDGVTGPPGTGDGSLGAWGGAILSTFAGSSLTLRRTLIDGNSAGAGGSGAEGQGDPDCGSGAAGGSGGGISTAGALEVEDSEISGNHAGSGGGGGGLCTQGGQGAPGGDGGGIYALGTVTITDTTISGNFAGDGGSGSAGSTPGNGGDGGDGGGLRYGGGDVPTLTNVTIASNE